MINNDRIQQQQNQAAWNFDLLKLQRNGYYPGEPGYRKWFTLKYFNKISLISNLEI